MKEGEYIRILERNKAELEFFQSGKYVYRFLPLERLLETLHNKQLTFVSPTKWNDPFDNFLFRQNGISNDSFLNRLYVMCFTHNPHSQAYWKTYSPNEHCVRLRLRKDVLIQVIQSIPEKVWLGKMKYEYETKLVEKLKGTKGLNASLKKQDPDEVFLKTFHLKRMPFKYEEESRISILTTKANPKGLRKISFDPKQLISQMYLDPRMGDHEVKAWKEYFKQFKIPVQRSLLFKNKKITIQ
ncbi:hypothetical protein B4Q04_03410 [Zobellia sp. OII3]|uniref:hypothetical protein n=1 Tax=Zobellia sp. OII3 TaxID=2034520 RepID=UPI000B53237A|nr:hypothetical protein [Zobellia sp. OII3]OWW26744.1 hypothetical protein B4Q04_03410 [Zobellia sp. OII3]